MSEIQTEIIRVRQASEERDFQAAYNLRYEVYIAEQGKTYAHANHRMRTLTDHIDASSVLFVAEWKDRICGTVRSNWFDEPETERSYSELFKVATFAPIPLRFMSVCSRLTVAPHARRIATAKSLLQGIYEYGIANGTVLCFATCVPAVLRIFRKYGSREFAPPIVDPAAGLLHRTVLVLDDLEYLETIGSPLLPTAERNSVQSVSRSWLTAMLSERVVEHAG